MTPRGEILLYGDTWVFSADARPRVHPDSPSENRVFPSNPEESESAGHPPAMERRVNGFSWVRRPGRSVRDLAGRPR